MCAMRIGSILLKRVTIIKDFPCPGPNVAYNHAQRYCYLSLHVLTLELAIMDCAFSFVQAKCNHCPWPL